MTNEIPPDDVVRELDMRVDQLGLSWELGPAPDGSDDWGFAVSFGGDPSRLARAREVVGSAPRLPHVQVLLGKPPKSWNGVVDLRSGDRWVRLSTSEWSCNILPMDGGVAIMVSPTGVGPDVDDETVASAVAIAVQSELGEMRFATKVRDLSVVEPRRLSGLPGIRCKLRELGQMFPSG